MNIRSLVVGLLALIPVAAVAAPVTFIPSGTSSPLIGFNTGTLVDGSGLTVTFTTGSGNFDATATSLGVDATGNANEVEPGESFSITFNQDVFLTQIDFSSFNNTTDALDLTIGANPTIAADGTQAGDIFNISTNNFVAAGQTVQFVGVGTGNGVGILNFTVETVTAVPEPSSLAVLGALACGIGVRRRRR